MSGSLLDMAKPMTEIVVIGDRLHGNVKGVSEALAHAKYVVVTGAQSTLREFERMYNMRPELSLICRVVEEEIGPSLIVIDEIGVLQKMKCGSSRTNTRTTSQLLCGSWTMQSTQSIAAKICTSIVHVAHPG